MIYAFYGSILVSIAENPELVGSAFQKTGGATSFRGQALLKNKLPGDVMFEDQGNFYFDPVSREVQAKGVSLLGGDPDTIATYQASEKNPSVQINNYYSVEKPKKETKKEQNPFERLMLGQLFASTSPTSTSGHPFQQMLNAIQRQGNQLADNLIKQYQNFGGLR